MINSKSPVIYWLREDFRIYDNLALTEAAKDNKNLILVYFSNYLDKQPGSAEEAWINNIFLEITKRYREIYGINVQCYDGDPIQYLEEYFKRDINVENLKTFLFGFKDGNIEIIKWLLFYDSNLKLTITGPVSNS